MNSDVKKEYKRLKKLKSLKAKSEVEIEKLAQLNIWKRQIDIESKFIKDSDKKFAKKLFDDYISNYEFDSFSDLNTLSDLIYEEVLKNSLQGQINEIYSKEDNNFTPTKVISALQDTEHRVLDLKERLGIGKEDKEKDDLTALEKLQKRFSKYVHFNRQSFDFVCPDCGQPTLIRRKCDKKNFDVIKHPFFAGRFYYNRRAMKLVKEGIISKETYAYFMQVSVQFVDWCLEHEHEIPDIEDFDKESFEEYISKIDYLKDQKIPKSIKNKNLRGNK